MKCCGLDSIWVENVKDKGYFFCGECRKEVTESKDETKTLLEYRQDVLDAFENLNKISTAISVKVTESKDEEWERVLKENYGDSDEQRLLIYPELRDVTPVYRVTPEKISLEDQEDNLDAFEDWANILGELGE